MFRFNLIGGAMLLGAALVSLLLITVGLAPRWAGTIGAAVMGVADLIYRGRQSAPGVNPWLSADRGGFLALGPSWAISLILVIGAQFGLFD